MQILIDEFDMNHFTGSGYNQFKEELEHFMKTWGFTKYRIAPIEGFGNKVKIIFHRNIHLNDTKEDNLR